MNGLSKISLCAALVICAAACGSKDNGNPRPVAPPYPNQPIGYPQQPYGINGQNGQNGLNFQTNPGSPLPQSPPDNPSVPNFSVDGNGNHLVINKQLRFTMNSGIFEVLQQDDCGGNIPFKKNSCIVTAENEPLSQDRSYCKILQRVVNLILNWDSNGILQITSYNDFGNAQSQPLAPGSGYDVDASGTISIGRFQLNGLPSADYVRFKSTQSGYSQFMGNRNTPFSSDHYFKNYNSSAYTNNNSLLFTPAGRPSVQGGVNVGVNVGGNNGVSGGGVSGGVFGRGGNSNVNPSEAGAQGSLMISSEGMTLLTSDSVVDPSGRAGANLRLARLMSPAEFHTSIIANTSGGSCDTEVKSFVIGEMAQ